MPTGARIRTDNVFGTTTDNPLLVGATTLNSAGLANLAAVSAAHAVIILDPLRAAGAPEIVIVTAHTASATSATITRGAYGSTARQHASGTLWVHAPTREDFIQILTSSTRPADPYQGQVIYETDTDVLTARAAGPVWQTAVNLGAWTAYTPTWSGTIGNGSVVGRYHRAGRLINFMVTVTWGSTTTHPAANQSLTLPAASQAGGFLPIGGALFENAGVALSYGNGVQTSINAFELVSYSGAAVSNTLPFAWGVADRLILRGTYEAAS